MEISRIEASPAMLIGRLKSELIKRLELIPGITHKPWPDRNDGFSTIHLADKEIGHFHNFNEFDLRLGKLLIRRERLKHPVNSAKHPNQPDNSQFIEIAFNRDRDLNRIVRLVKLLVEESKL